jgi:uroporphyrinogen decarboxylase
MTTTLTPVEPDWNGFLRNLRRDATPERVYYFEHGIADNVLRELSLRYGILESRRDTESPLDLAERVAVHRFLGHELFRLFPKNARVTVPTQQGPWVHEGAGFVTNRREYDAYDWPDPRDADLSDFELLEHDPPANMAAFHVLDLWEVVRGLMGFETLCFAMYDDPELVEAVFEKVGSFVLGIADALCDFSVLGAIYLADDLGHKSGLMLAPEHVHRFVTPWHKRLADLVHRKGKLFFFHSCGDMYALMDEYIDDVGIDAKHSFEENVLPVTEVKRRFGDRVALLGGVDVDLLARADETGIRGKTREILDICQPGGGYCLGSGNWVTSYIPVDSYIAMLDEARRYRA